jgi:hypothetical protein
VDGRGWGRVERRRDRLSQDLRQSSGPDEKSMLRISEIQIERTHSGCVESRLRGEPVAR